MLFKNATDRKIESFWKWFAQHSDEYLSFETNQDALLNELSIRLKKIDKVIVFELGPRSEKGRELTVSCDGIASGIEKVVRAVDHAPRLANWQVKAFRERAPVGTIELDGEKFSAEEIKYDYTFSENNRVNLRFFIKDYSEQNADKCMAATFILIDHLVGEYDAMTKIGQIEFLKLNSKTGTKFRPLASLPELVDSRKANK